MPLLLRSRRALTVDSVSVRSVPASPGAFHLAGAQLMNSTLGRLSALGHKRRDQRGHAPMHVRFAPESEHTRACPLGAISRHHQATSPGRLTAASLRVAGSGDRKETTVRWQHYRGWRAPLPRRKSTNPPANSCDGEVTLCGSNCWRLRFSLENRSTLIPAVTADLPGLLRLAACASEIAVIEPPYAFDERRVAPFTLTHDELNSLRPIHQPRQRRKSVLFGFSIRAAHQLGTSVVFAHHNAPHALKKHCYSHLVVARQQSRWDIDSKRTCSLQVRSIRIWLIANQAN